MSVETLKPRTFFRAVFICGGLDRQAYVAAFMTAHASGLIETVTDHPAAYAERQVAEYRMGRNPALDYTIRPLA